MPGKVVRRLRFGFLAFAALFLLIQLVPAKRTNPPVITGVTAPAQVMDILRRACFDCHSNETRWPWYGRVAPVSWWLVAHVDRGRADLNFSEWPLFDQESRALLLTDVVKQVEGRNMPLPSYALGHPEARLSDQERDLIIEWARSGI